MLVSPPKARADWAGLPGVCLCPRKRDHRVFLSFFFRKGSIVLGDVVHSAEIY